LLSVINTMGVDYIIHYDCEPKRALSLEGLVERLKGRDRAEAVIRFYRDQGDQRSPANMGFEMVRRSADGTEETEIIRVKDLLDAAEDLKPWERYCAGCPANRSGGAFGCVGAINYPISAQGERWLLAQLPGSDHPLPHMLLQKAIREMGYHGTSAAELRSREGVFFENTQPLVQDLGSIVVSGDQVFELLFLAGAILPAHGSMLLQFFGGISRDLDADQIMQLAVPPSQAWIEETVPFLHRPAKGDDETITTLKAFFQAMHMAYRLGVPLLLDV
jgi:hypothetical protein